MCLYSLYLFLYIKIIAFDNVPATKWQKRANLSLDLSQWTGTENRFRLVAVCFIRFGFVFVYFVVRFICFCCQCTQWQIIVTVDEPKKKRSPKAKLRSYFLSFENCNVIIYGCSRQAVGFWAHKKSTFIHVFVDIAVVVVVNSSKPQERQRLDFVTISTFCTMVACHFVWCLLHQRQAFFCFHLQSTCTHMNWNEHPISRWKRQRERKKERYREREREWGSSSWEREIDKKCKSRVVVMRSRRKKRQNRQTGW